jgi:hypothetical protein
VEFFNEEERRGSPVQSAVGVGDLKDWSHIARSSRAADPCEHPGGRAGVSNLRHRLSLFSKKEQ